MKILFATSSFSGGGITTYAHEVINNYALSHDVSVLVGDDSKAPIINEKIKVYKVDCGNVSVQNAKKILTLIHEVICPDVIINSNAQIITLISPYIRADIKIVTVAHSLKYQEADVAAFNHSFVDGIVALSKSGKTYLQKRFHIKDGEKIKVIYNFVSRLPDASQIRMQKKRMEPLTIVYPGGTAAAKSPEIVLKVMKRLCQTSLDFTFYWLGIMTPTLKKIQPFHSIKELVPLDSRIKFVGKIAHEEAVQLIANANILFSPSRREGCPIALLEAMRVGCIALVADYDNANKEIVQDGYNGFVVRHQDVDKMAEAISKVVQHHNDYKDIYDNSYESYQKGFSYEVWKTHMDQLLNSIKRRNYNRYTKFCVVHYLYKRMLFQMCLKFDVVHSLLFEYLQSAKGMFVEYLKFHHKN